MESKAELKVEHSGPVLTSSCILIAGFETIFSPKYKTRKTIHMWKHVQLRHYFHVVV